MLELIRLILETLSKVLPATRELKRSNERVALGSELFALYARVNEAMLCADDILDRLESLVRKTLYFQELGAPPPRNGIPPHVQEILLYQRVCLAQIAQTMNRLSTELNILDPASVAELTPLLRGKANILDAFLAVMKDGRLPVTELTADQLRLVDSRQFNYPQSLGNAWVIRDHAIPLSEQWTKELFESVRSYLEQEQPRERVKAIRQHLERLRETLEQHFTLQEILTGVGDRRWHRQFP